MDSLEIVISTKILNIVFLLSVYVPACLISCRWLLPHLGSAARRLAGVFMLAQLAAIALSLLHWHIFGFHGWLWDLNGEWNLPMVLAATQSTPACIALAILCLSQPATRQESPGLTLVYCWGTCARNVDTKRMNPSKLAVAIA